MTDELDPQTQQHIDDSADVAADTDAATCNDTDVDDATLDNGAATEVPTAEDAGEQNDDSAAQDDAPQAEGPIEVSSEEELDAVMDSMMDAVKAMKDAVADADIDAEEEEAAEAASTFVPGETPLPTKAAPCPRSCSSSTPPLAPMRSTRTLPAFPWSRAAPAISPRRRRPMRVRQTPLTRPPCTPPQPAAIWEVPSQTPLTPWALLLPGAPRPCAR